jgi:hypothetical protein
MEHKKHKIVTHNWTGRHGLVKSEYEFNSLEEAREFSKGLTDMSIKIFTELNELVEHISHIHGDTYA